MRRKSVALIAIALMCSLCPAWAQEAGANPRHVIDLRLGACVGFFSYAQKVDEGYYIDGEPYDLDWYALQAAAVLNVEYDLAAVPGLGLGLGGIGFLSFDPQAIDTTASVTLDSGQNASGGCGGVSASYAWTKGWRVNAIAGYGATGLTEYYGGYGPALSLGVERLFPRDRLFASIGLRTLFMYLVYPATEDTRGEQGGYFALMAEASADWMP